MKEVTPLPYHIPVMLNECIEGLNINPNGIYVDLTFGGGGHSKLILSKLDKGKLYGFDKDQDAVANTEGFPSDKFRLIEADFRYLHRFLKLHSVNKVDGILADLGISSHQIDEGARGFSTRFDGDLDMRMDQHSALTAAAVVNTYPEAQLHRIFGLYGEITNAKTLANGIVKARAKGPITTTAQLKEAINPFAPRGKEFKYQAQLFQALRIEVNQEMEGLQEMLMQTADVLKPGGRLVVLSYHSLEDRLVKNYIKTGNLQGKLETDFYGNPIKPLNALTRKPVEATSEEILNNNRARSAKLRIAEKPV